MKKYLALGLALGAALTLSACGFKKVSSDNIPIPSAPLQSAVDSEGSAASGSCLFSTSSSSTMKVIPPRPVPSDEANKTFSFKDRELGVALEYPGSCYYNLGVFQCSDFEMSIWELDASSPEYAKAKEGQRLSSVSNGRTEIEHVYVNKSKKYALKAWYDGTKKADIEKQIDKIAATFSFIKK